MVYERVTDAKYRDIIGFFRSRGRILALLIVNRETEKGYRPASTFFPFLDFRASAAFASLASLAINPTSVEIAGETSRDRRAGRASSRCRCIAGNCDRANNKTNWFIVFFGAITTSAPPHVLYASRAATASNPFAQKLKDRSRSIGVNKLPGRILELSPRTWIA